MGLFCLDALQQQQLFSIHHLQQIHLVYFLPALVDALFSRLVFLSFSFARLYYPIVKQRNGFCFAIVPRLMATHTRICWRASSPRQNEVVNETNKRSSWNVPDRPIAAGMHPCGHGPRTGCCAVGPSLVVVRPVLRAMTIAFLLMMSKARLLLECVVPCELVPTTTTTTTGPIRSWSQPCQPAHGCSFFIPFDYDFDLGRCPHFPSPRPDHTAR